MVDFGRGSGNGLWPACDLRAFESDEYSGDIDSSVSSVSDTLLHSFKRLSVSQQSTESYPKPFDDCYWNKPSTDAYLEQTSPNSNHIRSSVLESRLHNHNHVNKARVPNIQPTSRVKVSTHVSKSNYNSGCMSSSLYGGTTTFSCNKINNPPQPCPPKPVTLIGTAPLRISSHVDYVYQKYYRVFGNEDGSPQFSDRLWLQKVTAAALAILSTKREIAPRHRRYSNCSSRTKEWDKDALKLHSWFNAVCRLDLPRALKEVFLAVRKRLEYDYALCAFCRNNGESPEIYVTHEVRDQQGRVTCPLLRSLSCPHCRATGDFAHTISYCPYLKQSS